MSTIGGQGDTMHRGRATVSWEHYMPPPSPQAEGFLPENWFGACAPAACGDAFSARMRKAHRNHDFQVDRHALLHSAVGRGVLCERGCSPFWLGKLFTCSGLPLTGNIPRADGLQLKPDVPAYALGTRIESHWAFPLPPCSPATTPNKYADAMRYREHLCDSVDQGPIVVALYPQKHWATPRAGDEPYRTLPGEEQYLTRQLSNGKKVRVGHCIAVYGYECPRGDVRSLILYCQDNMIGTPGRLRMSPDVVHTYFVPIVDNFTIAQDPMPGNELTQELREAQLALESTFLDWDKIVNEARDLFSSPVLSNKVPSMTNCHASLVTKNIGVWKDLGFKVYYYGAQGQPTAKGYACPLLKVPLPLLKGLFEGLKACRKTDGSILLFHPEENAIRMKNVAERMCMPASTVDQLIDADAVKQTVLANKRWVPPTGKGSLYIRPLLIGSGAVLGFAPAPEYTFIISVSPVGNYFKEGLSPINLIVDNEVHRASPGGTGGVNIIGNYASVLKAQKIAKEKGYSDVLYLDAVHNKYLEVSSCNIFVVKGNVISTPAIKGTILPGITSKNIIEFTQSEGFKVEEHLVSVDDLLDADEVFCTGTAAVVSTVGNITHLRKRVECGKKGVGVVSRQLYKSLKGLQMGDLEVGMGWTML